MLESLIQPEYEQYRHYSDDESDGPGPFEDNLVEITMYFKFH